MDISLAQLLGLYFLIVGALALYRRKAIMPAVSRLVANRPLIIVIALAELLAGLAIVITYPDLTADWMGLISVIGWMLIVEAIIYLALPYKRVQKLIKSFNNDQWYAVGGVIAFFAGLYLSLVGFGFIA